MKGTVKERWGKLTDDNLNVIGGKRDQLVGRLQERYGIAKDEAQTQVDEWNKTLAGRQSGRTRQSLPSKSQLIENGGLILTGYG